MLTLQTKLPIPFMLLVLLHRGNYYQFLGSFFWNVLRCIIISIKPTVHVPIRTIYVLLTAELSSALELYLLSCHLKRFLGARMAQQLKVLSSKP